MSLPEHDRSFRSKTQMEEEIIVLLGGRVAEKIVLDEISTGASNDIERATDLARSMVTKYGFSEKLGPIVYGHDSSEVFLGRDYSQGRSYSENVAAEIDGEIRELIDTGYENAKQILVNHRDQLDLVANYLMEHEKIDGEDFSKLMKGESIEDKPAPVQPETVQSETVQPETPVQPQMPQQQQTPYGNGYFGQQMPPYNEAPDQSNNDPFNNGMNQ